MKIDDGNIKFIFYLDGNKYVVFSLEENIKLGDDLYFAKEVYEGLYESIPDAEYEKVLKEYKEYLENVVEEDLNED